MSDMRAGPRVRKTLRILSVLVVLVGITFVRCSCGISDPDWEIVDISTSPIVPTVLIVVDGSGSMTSSITTPTGTISRWEAVGVVWMDSGTGSLLPLETRARFGLATFNTATPCPGVMETGYALGNHGLIESSYNSDVPESTATLGDALTAMTSNLEAAGGTVKRVILNIDGEPGSCESPSPTPAGLDEAIAAVEVLYSLGIHTHVIGLSTTDISDTTLQSLANAGAGLPQGSNPGALYSQCTTLTEFHDAAADALAAAGLAFFSIEGPAIDPTYEKKLRVVLGDLEIQNDPDNGWTLENGSPLGFNAAQCIELHGVSRDIYFADQSLSLAVSGPEYAFEKVKLTVPATLPR